MRRVAPPEGGGYFTLGLLIWGANQKFQAWVFHFHLTQGMSVCAAPSWGLCFKICSPGQCLGPRMTGEASRTSDDRGGLADDADRHASDVRRQGRHCPGPRTTGNKLSRTSDDRGGLADNADRHALGVGRRGRSRGLRGQPHPGRRTTDDGGRGGGISLSYAGPRGGGKQGLGGASRGSPL